MKYVVYALADSGSRCVVWPHRSQVCHVRTAAAFNRERFAATDDSCCFWIQEMADEDDPESWQPEWIRKLIENA
jgi:hypothetical protein